MARFEVRVDGLDKLQRKLGNVTAPAKGMMADLANYTRGQAAIHAKPHPVDKGTLGQGVKVELSPPGVPLGAKVYTRSSIAYAVEEGQSANTAGSVRRLLGIAYALGRWGQKHGYIREAIKPGGRKPSPSVEAMRLAASVAYRGIRGVHFMAKAEQDARRKADEMVHDLAKRIEANWGH